MLVLDLCNCFACLYVFMETCDGSLLDGINGACLTEIIFSPLI